MSSKLLKTNEIRRLTVYYINTTKRLPYLTGIDVLTTADCLLNILNTITNNNYVLYY